jgi:hypothetical protein
VEPNELFRGNLVPTLTRPSLLPNLNLRAGVHNHNSPSAVQHAAASILYCLRLSFLIGMRHASETGDEGLQKLLSGPRDFLVQARPMLDLANVIRICRACDSQVSTSGGTG